MFQKGQSEVLEKKDIQTEFHVNSQKTLFLQQKTFFGPNIALKKMNNKLF